jgi:signal transduction histidine kinase/ligand-binding sensor domain-containing protein
MNVHPVRSSITILTALLSLARPAGAQSWRIDKLGVAEGLSQGYVYAIHEDRKGFIWIGTHGGLNRYDGYGFRVFQYLPFNAGTLGDNSVFFLKEDPVTGRFWIGGSSCLNEFDPASFSNVRYRYTQRQQEFSDGIFINDHEILLACQYEVLLFDTQKKQFAKVPVYNENNELATISRVENAAGDQQGNFMIMTRTGVFFYDPATKTCRRETATSPDLSPFYHHEVFNVLGDRHGYYWIATNNKGLIRYDPRTRQSITFHPPAPANVTTLRFDVVTEDGQQNIWAGSSNGLFRIDPQTMAAEYFSSDKNNAEALSHPEINVISEDKNHTLWIGTVGGGVNKMIPQNAGFKNFRIAEDKAGTYIMTIQPVDNDIWFANIWDQVGKVDMSTGKVTLIGKPQMPSTYSWYSEGSIVKTLNNQAALLNGERMFGISQKKWGAIAVSEIAAPGLSHIHYAANGKTYYMVKAGVAAPFCRNDTLYGNQFFYDARDDNAGNIWIGTSKGLIRFNTRSNGITQYEHDDKNTNSVSSNFIYALELDNRFENIWMAAYNGGLCSFNIPTGKFRHYTRDDGLADNIVYSLEKDHHGNIWFSSNAGISTYQADRNAFRNYSTADGLLNNEFNRRSSCKNDSGWLFFGGIFGIDYFHPDSIVKDDRLPRLAFTNFKIFNNDYIAGQKNAIPIIELQHNDRYISVEFAALGYNDLQKIQYAYRFGAGGEWIKLGNQHVLSFSALPTGRHHLYVRSTNMEGAWLDNAIACSIIIHPAWWQTWWFRLLAAFTVMAISTLVVRSYTRRKLARQRAMLERQRAIERERTRIATDMHDDLGAGLSRIKFLSETIGIKKQQHLPVEEEMGSIRSYSHEMIDKMGEIVWALNEKNDSLSDLLAYVRGYAVQYLSDNHIECRVDAPDQFPALFVSGEFRRNVYLTVKEALHNVVKHANARHVHILISIGEQLFISIRDDGRGFDESDIRRFSNGLDNMKRRIGSIGGRLEIKNNKGTTVAFSAPLP